MTKERVERAPPDRQFQSLLSFTSVWSRSIVQLCRAQGIPIVLGHDTTFFEKAEPSALERECQLGTPSGEAQKKQFATHKKYFPGFCARREALAASLSVPLAGPGTRNALTFIDEFHYDRDGTRALSDDFAAAIEALL